MRCDVSLSQSLSLYLYISRYIIWTGRGFFFEELEGYHLSLRVSRDFGARGKRVSMLLAMGIFVVLVVEKLHTDAGGILA